MSIFLPAEIKMQIRNTVTLTIGFAFSVAGHAYETVKVPPATLAICSQLAEVAYWAGTSHLSKKDKEHLAQAERDAKERNQLRPAIAATLVNEARKFGIISHGNSGPGNTSLDAARADAIAAATGVYEMCLNGQLAP